MDDRAELQHLREIDRMAELEAKASGGSRNLAQPAPTEEPGLKGGAMGKGIGAIYDLLGGSSQAVKENMANTATGGYLPEVVGGVKSLGGNNYVEGRDAFAKQMGRDEQNFPASALIGKGAGIGVQAAGMSTAAPAEAASMIGRVGQAAGMGGAQAALSNPGRAEGEVEPVQAGDRAQNGLLGLIVGGGLQAGSEGLKAGAQLAKDTRLVKNAEALYDASKERVKGAVQGLNEKVINPADQKIRELLRGKSADINLNAAKEYTPKLVGEIEQEAPIAYREAADELTGGFRQEQAGHTVAGEKLHDLQQALGKEANFKPGSAMDTPAASRRAGAEASRQRVRDSIREIAPDTEPVYKDSSQHLRLRDILENKAAKDPIRAVQSPKASTQRAVLQKIDRASGSDLVDFGDRMKSATGYLVEANDLKSVVGAVNAARKIGVRGAAEVARPLSAAIDMAPAGTKEAALVAALQAKRRNK